MKKEWAWGNREWEANSHEEGQQSVSLILLGRVVAVGSGRSVGGLPDPVPAGVVVTNLGF